MEENSSQVASLVSVLEDLRVEDNAASTSSATAKMLLDLPTDILNRIFNALLVDEDVNFQVACDGSKNNAIHYEDGLKPSWSLSWVPDLRLVSSRFKELITPIIGDHTEVTVVRDPFMPPRTISSPASQSPLKLVDLCPAFVSTSARKVKIMPVRSSCYMLDAEAVDVTGFPSLVLVSFGDLDMNRSLSQMMHHVSDLCERGHKYEAILIVGQLLHDSGNWVGVNGELVAKSHIIMNCFLRTPTVVLSEFVQNLLSRCVDDAGYVQVLELMVQQYWKIDRTKVIGITDSIHVEVLLANLTVGHIVSFGLDSRRAID